MRLARAELMSDDMPDEESSVEHPVVTLVTTDCNVALLQAGAEHKPESQESIVGTTEELDPPITRETRAPVFKQAAASELADTPAKVLIQPLLSPDSD
jgi:hypothetical protein